MKGKTKGQGEEQALAGDGALPQTSSSTNTGQETVSIRLKFEKHMRFFDSQVFQIILLSLNVLLNPGNVMSTNTPAEFFPLQFKLSYFFISLSELFHCAGRKYSDWLDIEVSALFEH